MTSTLGRGEGVQLKIRQMRTGRGFMTRKVVG